MNKQRITAGFTDFALAACIYNLLFIFLIMLPLREGVTDISLLKRTLLCTFASILYMVLRDWGGKSIGKKIMKLKICDKETEKKPAPPFKRVLRNITWLPGPFELYHILKNRERSGDRIAGTTVVIT